MPDPIADPAPAPLPRDAVIFVTGHRGLVGSAVVRHLQSQGFTNLVTATRDQLDLRSQTQVDRFFDDRTGDRKIEYVIHCAGRVGGILANKTEPADFLYDNQMIHATVLAAAHRTGVEKLLYLGSSCIYPRDCSQPIAESELLSGPLESTNDAYAIAKIAGVLSCQAYRRQHGCRFISAMPTNLYGPGDNFDPQSSHVLPGLIRRFHEAKLAGESEVTIWGTGTPRREFLHVDDLAAACLHLLESYDEPEPINVGVGEDLTIRELAETIRDIVHPEATLAFDDSKPDGTPRKLLDTSRITALGWQPTVPLNEGIRQTYEWFCEHADRRLSVAESVTETATEGAPSDAAPRWWENVESLTDRRFPPLSGKRALITGITGQDGSYLAEMLIAKGYEVWGLVRRSSSFNTRRIDHIYQDPHEEDIRLHLRYGDLSDSSSLNHLVDEVQPHEVYNLGAQSHVMVSFEVPEYTGDVTAMGAVRLLEAIRKLCPSAKLYQASSSELYGKVHETPQSETTPFHPRSPYAVAKEYAFSMTRNYREAFGMFAVNGILFNHESPRRGETFVTRKVTKAVASIVHGLQDTLYLGNLDAKRDWGFAGDYVEAMWMMLQVDTPEDFVIATGETHTVREFCEIAFAHVGLPLTWQGEGVNEVGLGPDGQTLVQVDPRYFRPAEVDLLLGDPTKAANKLGWKPRIRFEELVEMMVDHDVTSIWPGSGEKPAEKAPRSKPTPTQKVASNG